MQRKKPSARVLHRQTRQLRAREAPSLAQRFSRLESLTVEFAYLTPHGVSRNREIRFSVNLDRASSLLVVDCINPDCAGGDFDLSMILDRAVNARKDRVSGELECPGTATVQGGTTSRPCGQRIAYVLSPGYRKNVPVS